MTTLSDEILEECIKAEAHKPSQIIPIAIRVFEKRIDLLDTNPNSYYEWHCENARDYFKNEVKELLK
jgi:hypothetical protein